LVRGPEAFCHVAPMQDSIAAAAAGGKPEEAERWRKRLHHYLDWLFRKDSTAAPEFHMLQVTLLN
jgi:hypothetical protein